MRVDELVGPVTALGEGAVLALTYVNRCACGVLDGGRDRETEELREAVSTLVEELPVGATRSAAMALLELVGRLDAA